jgi:hypothetical protein
MSSGLVFSAFFLVAVVWHAFHRKRVPMVHRDGEEVDKRSSRSIVRSFDWDTRFATSPAAVLRLFRGP